MKNVDLMIAIITAEKIQVVIHSPLLLLECNTTYLVANTILEDPLVDLSHREWAKATGWNRAISVRVKVSFFELILGGLHPIRIIKVEVCRR